MSQSHVEIYTTPTCPDCATLKRWPTAQGVHYVERDLTNPRIADEARRRMAFVWHRFPSWTARRSGERRPSSCRAFGGF